MWFLPILVVGAIAMAVAGRAKREAPSPSRQLALGSPPLSPRVAGVSGGPGPIAVLGEILRIGQAPSPTVILCAIAEAQSIGRDDLASDIVLAFVAPVVHRHQRARARCEYQRGSCEIARSPRADVDACYVPSGPARAAVPTWGPPPTVVPSSNSEAGSCDARGAVASVEQDGMAAMPMPSLDDEINALLHADPARFMDMVSRSGTFTPPAREPIAAPVASSAPAPGPAPTVAQMQEASGLTEAADRTRARVPGSPIPGVPDGAWRVFVVRLERESPQFESSRHVGQFRQRRERLAELGIDPATIVGSAQAQRAALDTDLADAHHHGVAGELFSQHLGRMITVPGRDSPDPITLSGVLGVIQYAGLDGAVGWLERSNDRKRFPHTTQAFLLTNGVF